MLGIMRRLFDRRRIGISLLALSLLLGQMGVLANLPRAAADPIEGVAFFVSTDGDDDNPGTEAAPFATVERAQAAVRAVVAEPTTGDVIVNIRGGTYYSDDTLTFNGQDSGNNGHTVIYRSYPGEEASIVVGRQVEGWTPYSDTIYRAYVGTEKTFNNLIDNGERATMARHPNSGYLKFRHNTTPTTFTYSVLDYIPSFTPDESTQVYHWTSWHSYFTQTAKVIGKSGNTVEVEGTLDDHEPPEPIGLKADARYYLQGSLAFLDSPGEWYLDRSEGYLYYYPKNGDMNGHSIIVPNAVVQVATNGASDLTFDSLNFPISDVTDKTYHYEGTLSEGPQWSGTIDIRNGQRVSVLNSKIWNTGLNGVSLRQGSSESVIAGNWFRNIGMSGVILINGATNHLVTNNNIEKVGRVQGAGSGIYSFGGTYSEISHNRIVDSPRGGILLTEASTHHMTISYNEIRNIATDSQDIGAIYMYKAGNSQNVINNNLIADINIRDFSGQIAGIYMDDGSGGATITNNIITNVNSSNGGEIYGMFIKGVGNQIINNIIDMEHGRSDVVMWAMEGIPNRDLVFERNIFYHTSAKQIYEFWDWTEDKIASADNNVYYHESEEYKVGDNWHGWNVFPNPDTFEHWQQMGYDLDSTIGEDPLFRDRKSRDYTLLEGSPALARGFQQIDQAAIGLLPSYSYPVEPWNEGPTNELILEAEDHDEMHSASDGGPVIGFDNGSWIKFSNVNLGEKGYGKLTIRLGTDDDKAGNRLELRLDHPAGPRVGSLTVAGTGAFANLAEQHTSLSGASGVHDVYLVGAGTEVNYGFGIANVDYVKFSEYDPATEAQPDPLRLQAEDYAASSRAGMRTDGVVAFNNTDWIKYHAVNLGAKSYAKLAIALGVSEAMAGNRLELRLDRPDGPLAGSLTVASTGGYGTIEEQHVSLVGASGVHDLYLVGAGDEVNWGYGIANVDYIEFSDYAPYIPPDELSFQAEDYDEISDPIIDKGTIVAYSSGDWIKLSNVNLGSIGYNKLTIRLGVDDVNAGNYLELRLDSPDGPIVGSLKVAGTGGYGSLREQHTVLTGAHGIHDLYLVASGLVNWGFGVANVDYLRISEYGPPPEGPQGQLNLEAEDYDEVSREAIDQDNVVAFSNGDWIKFNEVDLGEDGYYLLTLRLGVDDVDAGHRLELRLDSADGPLVGSLTVEGTGGYATIIEQHTKLTGANGVHDLYVVGAGTEAGTYRIANVDHIQLSAYGEPVADPPAEMLIQAEHFDESDGPTHGGTVMAFSNRDWIRFGRVNLGSDGYNFLTIRLSVSDKNAGNRLELRLDAPNGKLVGSLTVASTGDYSILQEQHAFLTGARGIHDLYLVGAGDEVNWGFGIANVDYLKLSNIDAPTYTVTYYGNTNTSGTVPTDSQVYMEGQTVTVMGAGLLKKAGHSFAGWNTSADGNGTAYAAGATFIMGDADVTLYAQWAEIIEQPADLTLQAEAYDEISNADKDKNTLVAYDNGVWIKYSDVYLGTGYSTLTIRLSSADGYAGNRLELRLDSEDGPLVGSLTVASTGSFSNLLEQHMFLTGATGTHDLYLVGAGDTVNWGYGIANVDYIRLNNDPLYTVAYNGNTNTGGTVPVTQAYVNGQAVIVAGAGTLAKTGHSFAGWNTSADGSGTAYAAGATINIATANVTLYAQWTADEVLPAELTLQAEAYDEISNADKDKNTLVAYDNGVWIKYSDVYLGTGYSTLTINLSSADGYAGNRLELRLDSVDGTLAGSLTVASTGSFSNLQEQHMLLTGATGTHDLYLVGAGDTVNWGYGIANVDHIRLNNDPLYTVAYNGNTHTGGTVPVTQAYVSGQAVIVAGAGTLAKTGHSFAGWNTSADGSGTAYAAGATINIGTANVTLYAQWIVDNYTVTFNSNGGDTEAAPATKSVVQNATVDALPTAPTRAGYTFTGWNTAADGSGTAFTAATVVTGDITVYAQWTEQTISYTVTFNSNGGDTEAAPATKSVVQNATVDALPTAPTRAGYTFTGWNTAADGSGTAFTAATVVTGDITVYAQWTEQTISYTVTFNSNGGDTAADPATKSVVQNATVDALPIAPTRAGYTFAGWNTAADGSGTAFTAATVVTGDITVYAQWTLIPISYTVTFNSNGGDTAADPATKTVVQNETVDALPTAPTRAGYTFAGWNTAADGSGTAFTAATAVTGDITVYAQWTFNTNGGSTGGGGSNNNPIVEDNSGSTPNIPIRLNGEEAEVASATVDTVGGKKVTTIAVDETMLEESIHSVESNSTLTIAIQNQSDKIVAELNARMIQSMGAREVVLGIESELTTYKLPTKAVDLAAVFQEFGSAAALGDVEIRIEITNVGDDELKFVSQPDSKIQIIAPAVKFEITAAYNGQEVKIDQFNSYVERMILIPEGVDPSAISTGVVIEDDGSIVHVPTKVIEVSGQYYAVMNSLTNSVYSVIHNQAQFEDIGGHWASQAIQDMAARLILNGKSAAAFQPNANITRAEFAAIIIRALGLRAADREQTFSDVNASDWFAPVARIAKSYGLIEGYSDGTFRPNERITREQVMVIIGKAMRLLSIDTALSTERQVQLLASFDDHEAIGSWAQQSAAINIHYRIFQGYDRTLRPQDNLSRAEAAVIIQKLLKQSGLIN